jgi:hypothetical protein
MSSLQYSSQDTAAAPPEPVLVEPVAPPEPLVVAPLPAVPEELSVGALSLQAATMAVVASSEPVESQ